MWFKRPIQVIIISPPFAFKSILDVKCTDLVSGGAGSCIRGGESSLVLPRVSGHGPSLATPGWAQPRLGWVRNVMAMLRNGAAATAAPCCIMLQLLYVEWCCMHGAGCCDCMHYAACKLQLAISCSACFHAAVLSCQYACCCCLCMLLHVKVLV
jgi:hypothetical protein